MILAFRAVAASAVAAAVLMTVMATSSAAGHNGLDPCDRFPDDPRCSTSTTSSTTSSTTTTTLPGSTTTRPPSPSGIIGGIGCSTSRNAVNGYTAVSAVDLIANPLQPQWGQGVLERWLEPSAQSDVRYWGAYDALRPAEGYASVIVLTCLHNSEHDGSVTPELQAKTLALFDLIWSRDPGVTIWAGGKPLYPPGHVCPKAGALSDVVANDLATWAADLDPDDLIERAPVLGPLEPNMVVGGNDLCHLTEAGRTFTGGQLASFFD